REIARVVERAVDAMPETFRTVLMLRVIEDMTTAETAECLEIPEETVKTRLHRARGFLQEAIAASTADALPRAFEFGRERCDRVVREVLVRIQGETRRRSG